MTKAKTLHAYCYRNGQIGFGGRVPDGALPLGHGMPKQVREWITAVSRHAYKKGVYLVPGVPEAANDDAALTAYQAFVKWARPQLPDYALTFEQRLAKSRSQRKAA